MSKPVSVVVAFAIFIFMGAVSMQVMEDGPESLRVTAQCGSSHYLVVNDECQSPEKYADQVLRLMNDGSTETRSGEWFAAHTDLENEDQVWKVVEYLMDKNRIVCSSEPAGLFTVRNTCEPVNESLRNEVVQ